MKFYELRLWVRLYCGKCKNTTVKSILHVQNDLSRRVILGCKQCHYPVLQITLLPVPSMTTLVDDPDTRIDLGDFLLRERTF